MKQRILTGLLIVICSFTKAQDDETLRRLHGTVIKDNLFLRWNQETGEFQYTVDKETALWRSVKKGMLYNARNDHGNSIGFHIRFYNPLKHLTKLSFKDVDDPSYQAVLQFLSALPAAETMDLAGSDASFSALQQAKAAGAENKMLVDKITPGKKATDLHTFRGATILSKWIQEFISSVDYEQVLLSEEKVALYNELVDKVNDNTQLVDSYLFGKITVDGVAAAPLGMNDWITSRKKMLFNCPSDLDMFSLELAGSEKVLDGLQQAKAACEEGLQKLKKLLTEDYNARIKPLLQENRQVSFGNYSAAEAYWQGNDVADKLDKHKAALAGYEELVSRLKKFTADFARDTRGYRLENLPVFDHQTKTMRNFVYEIKELDMDGKDVPGSQHTCEFTIAKHQALVPFLSTGVFYTGFRYPNYAIEAAEGENRVAETGPTDVRVRPAVFLNLLFKTRSDWFYPFLQVGISTGVNDFLVPFGGGLTISNRFSISGGGMLGWRKDLTKLKPGDVVKDDAALQSDLSNRGVVSWYFSLNYNLTK